MRDDEVPLEHSEVLQGNHKLVYAINEKGEYHGVRTSGWEAEELVTQDANDWFDAQAELAKEEHRQAKASTLKFHMFKKRMDVPTLSQATGIWQWRVKRHLRYDGFESLPQKLQLRYAEAMGSTIDELRSL